MQDHMVSFADCNPQHVKARKSYGGFSLYSKFLFSSPPIISLGRNWIGLNGPPTALEFGLDCFQGMGYGSLMTSKSSQFNVWHSREKAGQFGELGLCRPLAPSRLLPSMFVEKSKAIQQTLVATTARCKFE